MVFIASASHIQKTPNYLKRAQKRAVADCQTEKQANNAGQSVLKTNEIAPQ